MEESGTQSELPGLPEKVPGMPDLPGPFPVGRYASELRGFLRGRPHVIVEGEVTGLNKRAKAVYFELRDAQGAVPCSMWRDAWDRLDLPDGAVGDGTEVVVAGGLDYYPGSSTASPSFSFRVTHLRPAGEGDLFRRLAELKKQLSGEGLFEPQKALHRPLVPKAVGVVTGRDSKARADVCAGLRRRGWGGRAFFAYPPVQDRRAAPAIGRALQDLAGRPEIEVIILARGGGSLADLWAFCDETLCRTVALLRVPVIAAVGHHTDETLIDHVAACCCSTPTHAAEEAIRIDIGRARADAARRAGTLRAHSTDVIGRDIGDLRRMGRTLAHHLDSQRTRLHQLLREVRASSERGVVQRRRDNRTRGTVVQRKAESTVVGARRSAESLIATARRITIQTGAGPRERASTLQNFARTLEAHHPDRVLERGFALVEDGEGAIVADPDAARRAGGVQIRFSGGTVGAQVRDEETSP